MSQQGSKQRPWWQFWRRQPSILVEFLPLSERYCASERGWWHSRPSDVFLGDTPEEAADALRAAEPRLADAPIRRQQFL